MTITLPLTVTSRGLPVAVVGLLLTVSAVTVVLAQPLLALPRWRHLDDPTAMALGFVVLAAGLALTGLATSLAAYVAATVVWSIGDVLLMGRAYALVSTVAPEHARGSYFAAYGTSWGFAAIIAPLRRHPAARPVRAGGDLVRPGRRVPGPGRGVRSRTWTPRPPGTWRR